MQQFLSANHIYRSRLAGIEVFIIGSQIIIAS